LGYSRETQGGTGIATDQTFGTGSAFPLFSRIKWQRNEYRIGNELHWHHTVFIWTRAWADFKDDSTYSLNGGPTASLAGNNGLLTAFIRTQPFHGTNPYWTAALFQTNTLFTFNGRFTYTGGQGAFLSSEGAAGLSSSLVAQNVQITTFGQGKRPVATGNATFSLFPTSKLTIVNHTSIYNVRTEGNNEMIQLNNLTQLTQTLNFQSLGIRTVATDADLTYQLTPGLALISGYEYSNRRINSVEESMTTRGTSLIPFSQTNQLHSGNAGFRWRPLKPLSIMVDGEIGRANLPFTPKSEGNFNAIRSIVNYRVKNFQASASLRDERNATSVTLSSFSSHSRVWSASASWSGSSWLSLDANYSKLHVDTLGGINFFANGTHLANQVSYYLSNLHTASAGVRLNKNRFTVYFGGSLAKDTGDGRGNATSTTVGPAIPAFQAAQTFPLQYLSPVGRLSIRISERIRWNAGFQLFDYQTPFSPAINFVARTGYTSLLWSF